MYGPEEFKETALRRGYARIGIIQLWMKENPAQEYFEDDLYDLYRFAERKNEKIRVREDSEERRQRIRDSWLSGGDDRDCNGCGEYDPMDGVCNLLGEYRHGYDTACEYWHPEDDT